jgi:malate dehydrogenase (oxaloacetate-decarboxylating)
MSKSAVRPPEILADPISNRGSAFTDEERRKRGIVGRLPSAVQTLDQQAQRAYAQMQAQPGDVAKNVYLEQLHDRNETLYYRLLSDHLTELLPIVYDPTVGQAIKLWSHEYRQPRGVYLSIDHPGDIRTSFEELGLGRDDVDMLVVTDAEEILGIGDWGVNGIQISVGKLAVYTAAAGIHPGRCIPVSLDVGTNNEMLLNDPLYLGERHSRRRGKSYDDFIAAYIGVVSSMYPGALLHFEDFGPGNARRILETYADQVRIFNDDEQGTGAIVLAGVLSALKVTKVPFRDQKLVIFGAGTAGVGIADQLRDAMIADGASREQATRQVWLIDKQGLLTDQMDNLRDYQAGYARPAAQVQGWASNGRIDLLTVIERVKPTILIGTSTDPGSFTKEVVEAMSKGAERPIIFPISNPTERIEAMPADVLAWSGGRALVATGIPVDPVRLNGTTYTIGQANNALLYPGLGLGTIISRAAHVTPRMILAAADAVASQVDPKSLGASLLPDVKNLRASSAIVAIAVIRAAVGDGVATANMGDTDSDSHLAQLVQDSMWQPVYPEER